VNMRPIFSLILPDARASIRAGSCSQLNLQTRMSLTVVSHLLPLSPRPDKPPPPRLGGSSFVKRQDQPWVPRTVFFFCFFNFFSVVSARISRRRRRADHNVSLLFESDFFFFLCFFSLVLFLFLPETPDPAVPSRQSKTVYRRLLRVFLKET